MVDLRDALQPAGSSTPLPLSEIAARAGRRRRRRMVTGAAAALLVTAGTAALISSTFPRPNAAIVADVAEPTPSTANDPDAPANKPAPTEADPDTTPDAGDAEPTSPDTPGTDDSDPTGSTDASLDPADAVDPPVTAPPGTATTTGTGQPDPGSVAEQAETTPGLRTETTTTSQWEDGYCVEIEVTNDADTPANTWQVVLDLDGTIATIWSATVDESANSRFVFSGVTGYNATLGAGARTTFGACLDTDAG